MKVSVILPTYNEASNIKNMVNGILNNTQDNVEIIVVDDNSPDKTWQIVADMAREDKRVKIIRRINERGLASALLKGVKESTGNFIVWMDSDLSMPPSAVPRLIKELNSYDIAVGSRYVKGGKDKRPFIRYITSKLFNLYANLLLGFKVRDMDSGFMAVRKEVFNNVTLSKKGYGEYCVTFIYKCLKKGYKVKEVPYIFTNREIGTSKTSEKWYSLLKHGLNYGIEVLKIRFNWK
mgnify:CR=1 FL=1